MTTQQEIGHLSTLIQRVKDEETSLGYARKETLVNVAEFILSWPSRYSREEYEGGIKVLARYHLAHLANRLRPAKAWKLINAELAKSYKGRCARCGKALTNPVSLEFGHGPTCRKKLGISSKPSLTNRGR